MFAYLMLIWLVLVGKRSRDGLGAVTGWDSLDPGSAHLSPEPALNPDRGRLTSRRKSTQSASPEAYLHTAQFAS